MKSAPLVLPRLSKNKNILQGTTAVSLGDFNFFHGPDRRQVRQNIKTLKNYLRQASAPLVLAQQVHGKKICMVTKKPRLGISYFPDSDALITSLPGVFLGILTADCLPVFIFDRRNKAIGLVHAGWRGIAQGIVPATIAKMKRFYYSQPTDLVVGIGPHISRRNYEVDADTAKKLGFKPDFAIGLTNRDGKVQSIFVLKKREHTCRVCKQFFRRKDTAIFCRIPKPIAKSGLKAKGKIRVSLAGLVKDQLKRMGVPGRSITETALCTYASKQCYSYRRQGKETGRMLSFLLLK